MKRAEVWSYGGGVQSIAILCLIAKGKLPKPDLVIMANTSYERSTTWEYLEKYARPLMNDIGLSFELAGHELSTVDLYAKNGQLLLPAFTKTGKLPTFCSNEWKKRVVMRKLKEMGYGPKKPVDNWVGFSLDEYHRMRTSDNKWLDIKFPLIFEIPKRRHECILLVEKYGLPTPPSSSCYICPNMNNAEWQMVKDHPSDDFEMAIKIDREIREKDTRGGVWLHKSKNVLDQADFSVEEKKLPLFECADSCWT